MNSRRKLGILGGMGPEASVLFYKKITDNTEVERDQDHIDILLYSHASAPDRTKMISSGKSEELWKILKADATMLKSAGCDYLAIPCNTSHYFASRFDELMDGKFINMIEETADYAKKHNFKRVGILATDGTVTSDIYGKALRSKGIEAIYPSLRSQKKIMTIIYNQIKRGEKGDRHIFMDVIQDLRSMSCEAAVLACTELSVFNVNHSLNQEYYIDALNVLSSVCIEKCGGKQKI